MTLELEHPGVAFSRMGRRFDRFRVRRVLVALAVWCLFSAGLAVPVAAQSGESLPVPSEPPVGVGGGLEAGQVDGAVGSVSDGFVEVDAELGSPPMDGPLDEGLSRLDESGAGVGGSGQEGEPGPVADVFEGGFLEAPVEVEAVEGPAPEGFGGLAMCAGGYVCGSAPFLPGPTGLSCSVTASVIVFSWNAVSGADDYTAKLQLAVAGSPQTVRTTSSTSVVYAGLSSSTTYYIGVHSNVGGVAQYFSGVYCTTAVGPPLCGVVSGSGVQLVWSADSRVHQWFVGRATVGSQYTDGRLLAASTLSAIFTGLEANVSYTFFFWWRASPTSAWNQVHPSRVCTTTAPPEAPVVTCTTTASTISANWGPARGAVRYRVSRGSGWAAASGLSHVFSNLSESTAYTVRVQGWNTAGWGQTGTAACTTKSAILPAPTGLECEATSSQIKFSWDEVTGADSYSAKIQLAQPGSAQTQMPTTSTSVVFTGLMASTKYWASVLAVKNNKPQNFAGVNCTTLADINAPTPTCTATSTAVAVLWKKVDDATRYRARVGGGTWTGDITATAQTVTHTFTGLAPGTMHTITVQSGNAGEWGNAAKVRCVTAAAGVYCDDTTSDSVVLEWDPVDGAKSWYAAISTGTGYFGRRTHNRRIDDGTSTVFTGLEKGTRYVMLLWWYDGNKWHPITPPPECWTKHLDTPVLADKYTTGGTTLSIQWAPVEGAQRYQVKISPAGTSGTTGVSGQEWTTVVSTGTFHTFTGRVPGTEYTVQLRAVDAQGNPSAAAASDRRASRVKCAAVTATTITLEWDDANSEYEWQLRRITGVNQYADPRIVIKAASTQTTFTGLNAQTEYWFAVDRRIPGTTAWEAYTPFPHCHTAPTSPKIVQCPQAADVDGTIRWESNGAYYYRVTLDHTQTDPEWVITNSTAHTFTGLAEGKTYEVAVQAWNPQGWSEDSVCEPKMQTLPAIPDDLVTGTGRYHFTEGTVKGVLYAAESAISDYAVAQPMIWNSCQSTMDKTKLAAVMLSIPPGEAHNSTTSDSAPSPMTLSRGDNFTEQVRMNKHGVKKSLNLRTYSHVEETGYERAHWSPGVGPWQLDWLGPDVNLNHAERADTTHGGKVVASFLLRWHCSNTNQDNGLKFILNDKWYGCKPEKIPRMKDSKGNYIREPDECYRRYVQYSASIYKTGNLNKGVLNIVLVKKNSQGTALNQVDGGIYERLCRWPQTKFPCHATYTTLGSHKVLL